VVKLSRKLKADLSQKKVKSWKEILIWVGFTGGSLGLALWSKLPAVLFMPILGLWAVILSGQVVFKIKSWLGQCYLNGRQFGEGPLF
jgi:hypothetical protein